MISDQLPALQVVLPLLAAPVCVVLRHARLAWGVATVVSWLALAVSLMLLERTLADGVVSYHMGGWAPPWGIEYRVDVANAFVLVIVGAIGALVMPFARASVEREVPRERIHLFYTLYLLSLAGLLGIAITGDAFNLFVFLEISSLSSYALIALGAGRRALTAAFHYLVLGTIGATFIVIGIGLMYMMTGTLNMHDLAGRLPAVEGVRTVEAALAFLVVGISIKAAIFPLHLWLPNAYAYAPSVVTAFLAATATKVSVYVLLRFLFTVFGGTGVFATTPVAGVLMILAVAAMFVASLVAIFQTDVKRMLAYSSVAQIGYMILGVSFLSVTGLAAGIVHLFNHALMKCALFLALGCMFLRVGSVDLADLAGIGRRMPWTSAAFVVGGLSLIGVPATVGFVSKWYLVQAALEKGWWPVAVLILMSSLLAVIYIWRVVEVAYFRPVPAHAENPTREAPLAMLVPLWVLAGASVYFGINATDTMGVARSAAAVFLGSLP